MQYLYLLAPWAILSCNSNMGMITSKLLEEIVGALYHRNISPNGHTCHTGMKGYKIIKNVTV